MTTGLAHRSPAGVDERPRDAATRLAPSIAARALEAETERCVPVDLVDDLRAAGLLKLYLPASLGGLETDPLTVLDVVETISAADGSAGWTTFILNATYFVAWLEPDVARTLLADEPGGGFASSFGPFGRVGRAADGQLRLDGRWPFNSAAPHASWFANGALVDDGPSAAGPQWRFVFFRSTDAEILDTWRAAGLRATASHDVVVEQLRIAPEFTADPIFGAAHHDGALFRWSFFAQLGTLFAGFPLGVARRAIDEFVALAARKSRGGAAHLADESHVALAVARAESRLRSARTFVVDAVGRGWERALDGDPLTLDERVAIRLATANAMDTAIEVVDAVFHLSGGGALYDDNPLQRCWRDAHAGGQHLYFSSNHRARSGQALLGGEVPDEFVI
jgi:alkylation response protein AidB-like acyl-CoA dehydrogenase